MQLRDAEGNEKKRGCNTANPTDWRPAKRLAPPRRDRERPGRGLHRQGANGVGRLTQAVEAQLALGTACEVVGHASLRVGVELVVDIG
jgi:hypothetical protein